ncbi:hypothetical protein JHK87_006064 [Glycine soja]|nr:hypothetical protein JHK87_006064 [Glycine soja]
MAVWSPDHGCGHLTMAMVASPWLSNHLNLFTGHNAHGSGYTISFVEMKEILSGKKFVWSVRPPVTKAGTDKYLTAGDLVQCDIVFIK